MHCPACSTELKMSERSGIEIDYCPSCRGVWLDRGELDKIIERNASQQPMVQPSPSPSPMPDARQHGWTGRDQNAGYGKPYKKRRKSFLEELFD